MQTLNQIAENIAYKLGDQFNHTLRESIKLTILDYRSKFIRDDLDRNYLSEIHFVQTGILKLKVVNLLEEFKTDYSCISVICSDVQSQETYKVLVSDTIPIPIRLKNSNRSPFLYLGRKDGSKNFTYTTLDKFPYIRSLPYSSSTIYYTIINNKIYIINNLAKCDINQTLRICDILLKGIFEDPRDFYNACENNDTFIDDMPFPISRDMLMQASQAILKGEYPLVPKDGEQINIKPDDNE